METKKVHTRAWEEEDKRVCEEKQQTSQATGAKLAIKRARYRWIDRHCSIRLASAKTSFQPSLWRRESRPVGPGIGQLIPGYAIQRWRGHQFLRSGGIVVNYTPLIEQISAVIAGGRRVMRAGVRGTVYLAEESPLFTTPGLSVHRDNGYRDSPYDAIQL